MGLKRGDRPGEWLNADRNWLCDTEDLPYSTSIAAAWEVVEKLRVKFPLVKVESRPNQRWQCEVYFPNPSGGLPSPDIAIEEADTAPLAICRAALKAVGP